MQDDMLPLFEEAEPLTPSKTRKKPGSIQVVLVQSICCAVLVLLFWLFKVLGGNGYTQLKTAFQNALQNNALLASVSNLFHETKPDDTYLLQGGTTGTGTTTTAPTDVATTGNTTVPTTAENGTTSVTAATPTTPTAAADG